MQLRIALAALVASLSHDFAVHAAKCQEAAQVVAFPSYAPCDAATGGALNVETPTPAPVSEALFCQSQACLQLWEALSGIKNGLNCLKGANEKYGAYDLSTDSARACFIKYGAIPSAPVPAPAPAPAPAPPTPTTAAPTAPTTKAPVTTTKTPSITTTSSPGTPASTNGDGGETDDDDVKPATTLPPPDSSSTDTDTTSTPTGGSEDTDTNGQDNEGTTTGTNTEGNSTPEAAASWTGGSESATTRANRTTSIGPEGSPVGGPVEEDSTGSSSVWVATGGSSGGLFIVVFTFILVRRRKETAAAESLTTPAGKNEYVATLHSSRSRRSMDASFPVLGASGVDAFVVPNAKFAFWDDEAINAVRIPYEKLAFNKLVSRGGYGEVHCGRYRDQLVAIKTLLPDRRKDMRQIESFLAEVKLMAALEHDHIVRFVGVAWDSLNELCVVSEFMPRGDLRTLLWEYEVDEATHPRGFNLDKIKIALHVAHALTYMHSLQPMVLHRDLKSRNILLDAALNAKVTDFGVSREHADSTMTVGVGSSLWMAPEVMMGGRYDEKADVFSFGVVLSELDVHALPYSHAVEPGMGRRLPDAVIMQMMTSGRINVDFSADDWSAMAQLGRECVSLDPAGRPSTAELQHRIHTIWKGVGGRSQ